MREEPLVRGQEVQPQVILVILGGETYERTTTT